MSERGGTKRGYEGKVRGCVRLNYTVFESHRRDCPFRNIKLPNKKITKLSPANCVLEKYARCCCSVISSPTGGNAIRRPRIAMGSFCHIYGVYTESRRANMEVERATKRNGRISSMLSCHNLDLLFRLTF